MPARIEIDATLVRTAMSPGIREQGDAFPLIANPAGKRIVGQSGSFIDGFLGGIPGKPFGDGPDGHSPRPGFAE